MEPGSGVDVGDFTVEINDNDHVETCDKEMVIQEHVSVAHFYVVLAQNIHCDSVLSSFALCNAATATSLVWYTHKYLRQWRADQQQSVSHHHLEDSLL